MPTEPEDPITPVVPVVEPVTPTDPVVPDPVIPVDVIEVTPNNGGTLEPIIETIYQRETKYVAAPTTMREISEK